MLDRFTNRDKVDLQEVLRPCHSNSRSLVNSKGILYLFTPLFELEIDEVKRDFEEVGLILGKLRDVGGEFEEYAKEEWIVFAPLISELALLTILLITVGVLYRMRTKVLDEPEINQPVNSQGALLQGTNVIVYDFSDLAETTNNFLLANKIGHGGFGNVYKGVLENGVVIAVKNQDVTSRQGFTEFENEFKLIAKLQHRNLTKLLGYCINGAEKFLVYEFMADNNLDKVIFGMTS
ncbi:cysteine-rich receptor-like protein kinase 19 [Solanum stenotomum]|uniref:cysteine-rich receptor-like protein kinase 19 n=1 Tax=Solanum stenotomum TaxID=172797 RepID=UPI0020D0E392|nr:cysteine-rich receptor-like protein kinase 19 [Solanum stenotomum]